MKKLVLSILYTSGAASVGEIEGRHENWEIVSCTGSEMVNKALHRRTDGSTHTITAHLKKVE